MKKIIVIVLIILLIALGLFMFLGNGKEKIQDFFADGTDFGSFFDVEPQSQNDFIETPQVTDPVLTTTIDGKFAAPILRQISYEPVSGYMFYATTSTTTTTSLGQDGLVVTTNTISTTTAIRFQERATGHIYDVFEFIFAPQKVSNITTQKIYNTIFSTNPNVFLHQTLAFNNEQIRTTFNKLIMSTSTPPSLAQSDLSAIVTDFVYNIPANKLIYSIEQNNNSNIYTANIDKTAEKLVTTLSFNEFLIDPINATDVLLTTKASQRIPGYSYILNTTTGAFNKILGNIPGLLVKVSPDKKYYIYSQSEQTRPSIRIYNTTTQTTNLVALDTIPEKCIFSQANPNDLYCFGALTYRGAQYPDDWYKGKIFNSDSLYKIDLSTNYIQQIYNFEVEGLSFDAINPQLTYKDGFLLFQSKYDLTLWSLDINRVKNEVF